MFRYRTLCTLFGSLLALTVGWACGGRTLDTPSLERGDPAEPEPVETPPKAPAPTPAPGEMAPPPRPPPPTTNPPPVDPPVTPPPVDPEPPPPPVPACPTLSPCGGTPVGNFRLSELCLTPPYGYYLLANCPEGHASLELVANYDFAEDQSYTLHKQLVRTRSAPTECRDFLAGCDEPLVCSNESCTCTERQAFGEQGKWKLENGELLMTTDAGDTTVFSYCRNGESLTLESVSDQYTSLYQFQEVP